MGIKMFHGEKGGVGKSFACVAYIDYLLNKGVNPVVIECDTSNPDVKRVCVANGLDIHHLELREKESFVEMCELIESFIDRVIVINLPAGIRNFFNENNENMVEVLNAFGFKFDVFFVINNQVDSIKLLKDTLESGLKDCVEKVVVVKNEKFGDENSFSIWNESNLKSTIKESNGYEVSLYELSETISNDVYNKGILFSKMAESSDYSIVKKVTVKKWMQKMFAQFVAVGE